MLETKATIIDQIVDLHDRMIGALFNRAKRAHAEQFQQSARAINEKLRLYWRIGEALLEAKRNGSDPFHAIENRHFMGHFRAKRDRSSAAFSG